MVPASPANGNRNGNGNGHGDPTSAPTVVKHGQLPPPLTFKDPDSKPFALASYRGAKTLLLFWNPGCGFCQAMLDNLKAWEANPPKDAPRVLVISSGIVEANRELGLRSKIVLDPTFRAGSAFGANGTPMASSTPRAE